MKCRNTEMKISVQNQKGGTGKTTLSLHISHALALRSRKVLLVDADPQGSARDWAAAREKKLSFSVVGLDRPTIHRDLPELAADFQDVVIDGPPRVSDLARSAIVAADIVLIPIQPSPYDVWAVHDVVELIQEAAIYKTSLKAAFIINRMIVNTAIGRDVKDALADYPFPIFKSAICQRVAFAESAARGLTVLETNPKGTAAAEVLDLTEELLNFVGDKNNAA